MPVAGRRRERCARAAAASRVQNAFATGAGLPSGRARVDDWSFDLAYLASLSIAGPKD